jgi:uncharacterized protein (TIGR02145 family)
VVGNRSVSLKISILFSSINGSSVYSETHAKTTDASGLISLQIGNGTLISGIFANIDWGGASHFIKLEVDFSGGSNYVVLGTQELMSVPYAMYASKTDTSVLNLANRLATKLNGTDTVSLSNRIDAKAPLANPVFTGTVLGIDKTMVGLSNVDNTTDLNKPVSTATLTALGLKAPLANPNFTGTVTGVTKTMVGLGNVDNTTDAGKPVSTATQTALDLKENASNKSDASLGTSTMLYPTQNAVKTYVDSQVATGAPDATSSVKGKIQLTGELGGSASSPTVPGLALKAPINNPAFTGTVTGVTKSMVGLGNVDNTTDAGKPVSTATQTALDLKLNRSDFPNGTNTGNILYWNGTSWVNLAPGQNGQALILVNGIPSWSGAAYATLTTSSVSSITPTSVSGGGNISSDGGAVVSARGLVYATTSNPTLSNTVLTIGSGTGSFSGTLTGLTPNTTYYVRAYATNSSGTAYGSEQTFTTMVISYATLTTSSISSITPTSVSGGGNISSDGGTVASARGLVYATTSNPTLSNTVLTIGSGEGSFSGTLTGLTPNSTYYVRAYATNSSGTAYGNEVSFTTLTTVTDIDGNTYNTVQIGNQVWMSENLKTTRYRNGGLIPNVTDGTAWSNSTTGAWSYYNNDVSNNAIYGKLYKWYTTLGDTLCPTGWGVPTDAEWTTLTNYLGGESVAGGKMKSVGTAYWISPNTGATNESVFSALPGGYRYNDGSFYDIRASAFFWSATEFGSSFAWNRSLSLSNGIVYRLNDNKSLGASVRCLRD